MEPFSLLLIGIVAGVAGAAASGGSKPEKPSKKRSMDVPDTFRMTHGEGIHESKRRVGYWKPHLTGTWLDETVHVPYKGQTTLGMFDRELDGFRVSEVKSLHEKYPFVFRTSGLEWEQPSASEPEFPFPDLSKHISRILGDEPAEQKRDSHLGSVNCLSEQSRQFPLPDHLSKHISRILEEGPRDQKNGSLWGSVDYLSTQSHQFNGIGPALRTTGNANQDHWLGYDKPPRPWPEPMWNEGCYEGTSALKPTSRDAYREAMEHCKYWDDVVGNGYTSSSATKDYSGYTLEHDLRTESLKSFEGSLMAKEVVSIIFTGTKSSIRTYSPADFSLPSSYITW